MSRTEKVQVCRARGPDHEFSHGSWSTPTVTATRFRGPAHEATDAAKYERAASACRHQGGITVAARGLLAEPRGLGNGPTWTIVKVKFPEEDRNSVQEAAAADRVVSVTEPEGREQ